MDQCQEGDGAKMIEEEMEEEQKEPILSMQESKRSRFNAREKLLKNNFRGFEGMATLKIESSNGQHPSHGTQSSYPVYF